MNKIHKNMIRVILSLSMILSLGFAGQSQIYASEMTGSESAIDASIRNSLVEEEFDNEVVTIRYLKEVENKSFDEINIILNQTRDIPYIDDYANGHMNDLEKTLYKENRAKALLCLANGKLAIDYTLEMYTGDYNNNGDAFRHTLWNFGMARDVGQPFAKRWSDAHENGAANNPSLEKSMDLHNNSIGLALAKENPTTTLHSTFKSKTREAVRSGRCQRIVNGKIVSTNSDDEK